MLSKILKPGKAKKTAFQEEPRRLNDAVLIIRQENAGKNLIIEASNFLALKLLGAETADLVEKDLRQFLPKQLQEIINENVEFTERGRGIDSVLNKIPNFRIKGLSGAEMPLKIRVIRGLSSNSAAPRFQLVMNDISLIVSLEAHRLNYRANMRGDEIIDKQTGLPSRESMLKDIEMISFYTERNHVTSCYVIFKFINFDDIRIEHDEDYAMDLFKKLAKTIEINIRANDIIGLAAQGAIMLILPETPSENITIPIRRISSKIAKEIKSELRIYYNPIKPGFAPEQQLNDCMKGLAGTF